MWVVEGGPFVSRVLLKKNLIHHPSPTALHSLGFRYAPTVRPRTFYTMRNVSIINIPSNLHNTIRIVRIDRYTDVNYYYYYYCGLACDIVPSTLQA